MSVKLPFLIKKQPNNKQHQRTPSPQPLEQLQSSYNYQHHDSFQQQEPEESIRPQQTITLLKRQQGEQKEAQLQVSLVKEGKKIENEGEHYQTASQLRKLLQQKVVEASVLRNGIVDSKKEIKRINEQIDKDLNKSLLKTNKNHHFNIRDVFSAPPKSNNQQINAINEHLKSVRLSIKKVKVQIARMNSQLRDPVAVINVQKQHQLQSSMRHFQEQVKILAREKAMLNEELSRGGREVGQQQQKQRQEEYSRLQAQLSELNNKFKEERAFLYQIQKQDICLMQKMKFLQEKEQAVQTAKKPKATERERERIEDEIKLMIGEINDILQERNKVENQKKLLLKTLAAEASSTQTKNWELCNRLRQIDAFLLQYYEKKAKKKQIKGYGQKSEKNSSFIERSNSGRIQLKTVELQGKKEAKKTANDKNIQEEEAVMVQKKKNYDFGSKEKLQDEILLSDDFLGSKLNPAKIVIKAGEHKIYNMQCCYQQGSSKKLTEGYLMGSKDIPEDSKSYEISLNRGLEEFINFIHVGYHEKQYICFLQIMSSQGKELRWGALQNIAKNEQKHIKQYQSSFFRAKVTPDYHENSEESLFCLSGLTLSTIFLSLK